MNYKKIPLSGLAVMLLASCAQLTPEQRVYMKKSSARPLTCVAKYDCRDKWNRTVQWAKAHAASEPDISKDTIAASAPADGSAWGYRIALVADMKGKSRIDFTPVCGAAFGCTTSELSIRSDFADVVLGRVPDMAKSGGIAKLEDSIKSVEKKCADQRVNGILKNHEEEAECCNPRTIRVFRQAKYPFMDLAREYTMHRMRYAKMVDSSKLTEDSLQSKMNETIVDIAYKEKERGNAVEEIHDGD